MRHQHAGLAIPDFPLAYGKIWPDTSAAAVAQLQRRPHGGHMRKIPSRLFKSFCKWCIAWSRWRFSSWRGRVRVASAWRSHAGRAKAIPLRDDSNLAGAFRFLAGADSGANCARRGDHLVEQGRRRGDGARAGGRAFARDRRAVVHYCLSAGVAALGERRASAQPSPTAAGIGAHPAMVGNK